MSAVLVIDDDAWIADYIGDVVHAFFGFTILKAESAETARALFSTHAESIVAIISDLSLRATSGSALVRELTASRRDIGVVFVTGHVENERELSKAVGRPVSLLMKPFGPVDLKLALQNRISAPSAQL